MEGDSSDTLSLSESVRLHFDGSGVSSKSSVASESSGVSSKSTVLPEYTVLSESTVLNLSDCSCLDSSSSGVLSKSTVSHESTVLNLSECTTSLSWAGLCNCGVSSESVALVSKCVVSG